MTKVCKNNSKITQFNNQFGTGIVKSENKVALFLFASHSFLANILRFMVKLIDKAIVINGKYIRIRGKCFIQAIKKVNLY
jgi:hypothetical protein